LHPDSLPANVSPESSDEVKENLTNEFEGSGDEDGDGDVVDMDSGLCGIAPPFARDSLKKSNGYRDFLDGLEYQLQFKDERMLDMVEREGAGFWQLAQNCLSRSVT